MYETVKRTFFFFLRSTKKGTGRQFLFFRMRHVVDQALLDALYFLRWHTLHYFRLFENTEGSDADDNYLPSLNHMKSV